MLSFKSCDSHTGTKSRVWCSEIELRFVLCYMQFYEKKIVVHFSGFSREFSGWIPASGLQSRHGDCTHRWHSQPRGRIVHGHKHPCRTPSVHRGCTAFLFVAFWHEHPQDRISFFFVNYSPKLQFKCINILPDLLLIQQMGSFDTLWLHM